jgi:hypothetical protein
MSFYQWYFPLIETTLLFLSVANTIDRETCFISYRVLSCLLLFLNALAPSASPKHSLICARCNSFGISPFQSERRHNLCTVSAKTKARLIQEVDARNGWELQGKKDEVKRVRKHTKVKMRTLTIDHKQQLQKLALDKDTELQLANTKHQGELTKLVEQKELLVQRWKNQSTRHKSAMGTALDLNDALTKRCTAIEGLKTTLVRSLMREQTKGESLLEHTNKLIEAKVADVGEAAVGRTVAEEALASTLKTNTSLMKGLKRTKERVTAGQARLKNNHKEDAKKRDAQHKREKHALEIEVNKTKAEVDALTAQVIVLQEELQQAKAVRALGASPVVRF